jgi:hypothetical protein
MAQEIGAKSTKYRSVFRIFPHLEILTLHRRICHGVSGAPGALDISKIYQGLAKAPPLYTLRLGVGCLQDEFCILVTEEYRFTGISRDYKILSQ